MITVSVYGCWSYGFGVLLDPIITDTGWSEVGVVAVFSASAAITGIGAIWGGWFLDRLGSRVVFGIGAVVGFVAFQIAAATPHYAMFAAGASIGGGTLGALGFYHITQTVAARIADDSSARAITAVTVWGAFAGTVYLPLTAWLISAFGWRDALGVTTASASVFLALGAVTVPTRRFSSRANRLSMGIRMVVRSSLARRFMLALGLAGLSISLLSVYQVPLMTTAGLSLGTASAVAGMRSLAQLGGRVPLNAIRERIGDARALAISFVAVGAGWAILLFASSPAVGVMFAVVTGYGIGSMSPLVGIHSVALFDSQNLGVGRSAVAAASYLAGMIGPTIGSAAVAASNWRPAAAIVGIGAAAFASVVARPAMMDLARTASGGD